MTMNLYLVLRIGTTDYDEYEGMVVAAPSEDMAIRMHPSDGSLFDAPTSFRYNGWDQRLAEDGKIRVETWTHRGNWPKPDGVSCKLIGQAAPEHTEPKVLLASYLAG
jgi:hypothetical protein